MGSQRIVDRLIRQWKILDVLRSRRHGVTISGLRDALEVSRPTVYRDLKVLTESPLPVRKEVVNGEARYRLEGDWPSGPPSAEQLLALGTARRMLASLEGSRLVAELDRYLGRAPAASSPIAVMPEPSLHRAEDVRRIEAAIRDGRRLRLRYQAVRDGEARERVIEPVELRHVKMAWYLVAWDVDKGAWRTLKLARLHDAEVLGERATSHPPYDAAAEFGHSTGIWSGEPVEVRLRIDAAVARFLPEYPLHADARSLPQPDGSVLVTARVAGLDEVLRWALRWGRHLEVLDPPALRERIAEELRAALGRYEPSRASRPASPSKKVSHPS